MEDKKNEMTKKKKKKRKNEKEKEIGIGKRRRVHTYTNFRPVNSPSREKRKGDQKSDDSFVTSLQILSHLLRARGEAGGRGLRGRMPGMGGGV